MKLRSVNAAEIPWVDAIPSHWSIVRLKFVSELQTGLTLGKDYKGRALESRPYLRVANVQDGFLDLSEITFVEVPAEDIPRYELNAGDVLMTEGGDFDKLGRGHVWDGQVKGCLHQNHIFSVRPHASKLDSYFLSFLLCSSHGRAYFTSTSQQTTNLATTNSAKLGGFPLFVPPIEEQAQIVGFLSSKTAQTDAVIQKKQRLIELLQEKRLALISQAVTRGLDANVPMKSSGIDWLGKVPTHWEVGRLKFRLKRIEQGWSPQCENNTAQEGEWGVLKVGCMNSGVYDESENKVLPPDVEPETQWEIRVGDVLMSRSNTVELVGSVGIVHKTQGRILLCDKLYRIHFDGNAPNPLVPQYAVHLLRSWVARQQIERDASGASPSMKNISLERVANLVLPYPPLSEQQVILEWISAKLQASDTFVEKVRGQIAKLREYRQTLITAAVTGKIDVRKHQLEASSDAR